MAVKLIAQYVDEIPLKKAKGDEAFKTVFSQMSQARQRAGVQNGRDGLGEQRHGYHRGAALREKGNRLCDHWGDSRAYLIRERHMVQITEDHTYVNQLLKTGSISKEEADRHPKEI